MISTLSLVLFSLQTAQPQALVNVNAPDVRVAQAWERAKQVLLLSPDDAAGITRHALTLIGAHPDSARPISLLPLHAYWNTTGDTTFVRHHWPVLRDSFSAAAPDTTQDTGVWLAVLDAAKAIAQVVSDAQTDSVARAFYPAAESRLAQRPSLYGLAFGMYEDSLADTLLSNLLGQVNAFWPLGNGLAALAFYEYHRESAAFAIVDAMMQGTATTAPMLVLPVMRGLIGWETDAVHRAAAFEPHLPASWNSLTVTNLPIGVDRVDATIRRDNNTYSIHLQRQIPGKQLSLRIAPALPAGSKVRNVTVNERDVPVHVEDNKHDVHVVIEMSFRREAQIDIEFEPPRSRPSIR